MSCSPAGTPVSLDSPSLAGLSEAVTAGLSISGETPSPLPEPIISEEIPRPLPELTTSGETPRLLPELTTS
ncbi:hypothetical protein HDU78_005866, partial [Chytriomyces hyalinus]